MALKTIETRAIVSASDNTGNVFGSIAEKLRNLESKAEGATKKLQATTKAASTAQAAGPKAERASGALQGIPSMITAVIAAESIRSLAEAIGARVHEAVKMETAGMTPAEIERAKIATASLARKYPSIPQTELMHEYRTARAIVGGAAEGEKALEMIAPLRVAMGNKPDAEEQMDLLLKSGEMKGITQDPKKFASYIDAIGRALQVFSESTLKPVEYFEAMKYARGAATGLSEKFITRVGPTLMQEMGGASFGTGVAAFNRAIVGGHMAHDALKQLAGVGLVRDEDLEKTSTGSIKGILPGRHIQGYQLAQSDPYEWVKQVFLPALTSHGITKKEDITAMISQLFSKQTAAQLVGMLATQIPKIEKDVGLLEKAKGVEETARILQQKDPGTQIAGLKNAAGDAVGTLGQQLVVGTGALNSLTDALGSFNEALTRAAADPNLVTPGQGRFSRGMNAIFSPDVLRAGPIVPGSAATLVMAKDNTAAAGKAAAAVSWRHPGDKVAAEYALGEAIKTELAAKEKFEAGRAPVSLGMHAGQRHLLGPAGAAGPAAELKGQATITNRLSISLDPGLIAKEVRSQLDAGGNLRADTGVSMSPSR